MGIGEKIYDVIAEIASNGSTKKKEEILLKNKDVPYLEEVLYLALSPRIVFYKKQISDYVASDQVHPPMEFEKVLDVLRSIHEREVTGHSVDVALGVMHGMVSEKVFDLVKRIILKDLKMDMGKTITNKVYKGLIETTPYQGAKPYSRKLVDKLLSEGSVYSQLKSDGCYSNCVKHGDLVIFESRQGEHQFLQGTYIEKQMALFPFDGVFNGELTIVGISDRATANGMITSIIDIETKRDIRGEKETQKKIDTFNKTKQLTFDEAKGSIKYQVWDLLTIDEYLNKKSDRPYNKRFQALEISIQTMIINNNLYNDHVIEVIESIECSTFEEVMKHYIAKVEEGMEGTIIKGKTSPWKDGKPNWAIKFKNEFNLDLKIVGYRYGNKGTKNEHLISSIMVESECGLLKTVPTNMKVDVMEDYTENQEAYLGKIIEVKCSGLSTDKDGNYSTLHPVVMGLRNDKDVANTLEEAKEIEKAILDL